MGSIPNFSRKIPALPENYLDIHSPFAANYGQPVVYHVDSDHDGKPEAGCPLWQLRYY